MSVKLNEPQALADFFYKEKYWPDNHLFSTVVWWWWIRNIFLFHRFPFLP